MHTALVTGASRGMGLEFVRQLSTSWKVIATCREPSQATELLDLQSKCSNITIEPLNVDDQEQILGLATKLAGTSIDLLLLNAAMKGNMERQHFGNLGTEDILQVLHTNAVAPLMIAQAFAEHVKSSQRKQIVCVSSGVGSIADNTSGGMTQYRMSKAALNMAMQEVKVKLKDSGVHVLCLVPGWVRTDMGGPKARLSPEEAVEGMLNQVVHKYETLVSGGLYDYAGKSFPW
mmetsp:Transcript_36708/g.80466  ORF Transcript_36708/g.80466 Transcript_36708/m.80466 type:complete len:232 (-) Transcript_36708:276-971(-)